MDQQNDYIGTIKKGIWIYFLLLIFEGALRKWLLPGLSTPLLLVRDPVAIWLIYMSWQYRIFTPNLILITVVLISLVSMFTTLFLGHGNVIVMLYGLRIFLFHFPVIFIIGKVFTKEDVVQIGKVVLWISIPMTLLVAMQFYSPQSAWVNRGVGGDESGAGFVGAMGFFRPPGTFSFTNGNTLFYTLVGAFVCYFAIENRRIPKFLLFASVISLFLAIPLAISRALFLQIGVIFVFTLFSVINRPSYLQRMLIGLIVGGIIIRLLMELPMFQTSLDVFSARFESAGKSEGGLESVLLDRYLGGILGALTFGGDSPFWGHGLGIGTNAGSIILTGGRTYLISEGEWGRMIGEFGAFLGLIIILCRVLLSSGLLVTAYRQLSVNNVLPFILLAYTLLLLPQGQWAQPTSLGFSILVSGLTMAASNEE